MTALADLVIFFAGQIPLFEGFFIRGAMKRRGYDSSIRVLHVPCYDMNCRRTEIRFRHVNFLVPEQLANRLDENQAVGHIYV